MRKILAALLLLAAATLRGQTQPAMYAADAAVMANGNPPISAISIANPLTGDLIYYDGSIWNRLGVGTNGQCVTSNGTVPGWGSCGAGGGAPTTSKYLLQQADGSLPNAQAMGALATGAVINTTTTGVQSIYGGVTCTNQFLTVLNASIAGTCTSVSNSFITSATIALSKLVNATNNSRLLGSGSAGSGASYTELSSSTITFGASSFDAALTTTNDGGAIIKQASTPGTQQATANFNVAGVGIIEKAAIAATPTDGAIVQNTTAATGGATVQYSPALRLQGTAWNSSGSQSEIDSWRIYDVPVTVAGTTTQTLFIDSSINGGAFANKLTLTSAGVLSSTADMLSGGNVQIPNTSVYRTSSRGNLSASADGVWVFKNNAGTFSTSAVGVESGYLQTDGANGSLNTQSSSTEQLTLSTGATTTNTAGNLAPANGRIKAITVRVTTTITTAANYGLKVTAGNAFNLIGTATTTCTNISSGTTCIFVPAANNDQYVSSATTLTVTTNVNPGAGVVRIVVFYETFTAPTS